MFRGTKFYIVEFTKNVFLTGEEIDWDIVGGSTDVYAMMKIGDKMPVADGLPGNGIEDGWLRTYNQNFGNEIAHIIFPCVPTDSYKISKNTINYDESIALKLRDWKTFTYNHQHLNELKDGIEYVENENIDDYL
jgi:hypothetical protein